MDNFKAVYKILTALEKAMDCPEFDVSTIGPDALGVSEERWSRYIEMMADVGYIYQSFRYQNTVEDGT